MIDELFVNLHDFSLVLLPILGVLALLYLIVLIRKVIGIIARMDNFLVSIDRRVEKLDGPLDTMVRLSRSVDDVHEMTIKGFKGVVSYSITHWNTLAEWFQELVHKSDSGTAEPMTENIKGDA